MENAQKQSARKIAAQVLAAFNPARNQAGDILDKFLPQTSDRHKATDLVCAALGGMMPLYGDSDRPPIRIGEAQTYFHAALHAAIGTMISGYSRLKTGKGQWVDVSIQEAASGIARLSMPPNRF
jgi:hypothetical protein